MKNELSCFEAENIAYWTDRASGYSEVNQSELKSSQQAVWGATLAKYIEEHHSDKNLEATQVLDVGTGPGFFAIVMAQKGYPVTAVDYTHSMLKEAGNNAGTLAAKISFQKMNAEELTFPDNSFEVIVTRNLTWNLPNPEKAYRQWERVLKPGGLLLNFDANWYNYLYSHAARKGYLQDRENIKSAGVNNETDGTDIPAMEAIAYQAPLSSKLRPDWDVNFLADLGMRATADTEIWQTVWTEEEKINNASTPMFLIRAIKATTDLNS